MNRKKLSPTMMRFKRKLLWPCASAADGWGCFYGAETGLRVNIGDAISLSCTLRRSWRLATDLRAASCRKTNSRCSFKKLRPHGRAGRKRMRLSAGPLLGLRAYCTRSSSRRKAWKGRLTWRIKCVLIPHLRQCRLKMISSMKRILSRRRRTQAKRH